MGIPSFLIQGVAFSCIISIGIAVLSEIQTGAEESASILYGVKTSVRSQALAQGRSVKANEISILPDLAGSSALPNNVVRQKPHMSSTDITMMWITINSYMGKSNRGRSRDAMKKAFDENLPKKILKHLSESVGGIVEEFGDIDQQNTAAYAAHICVRRPSLTVAQVEEVARKSFGLETFHASFPPCDNGGTTVPCDYDSGNCCRRPQIEFIGRYYDTAVAAMALGATLEEAFAPLVHARTLAYALEACYPKSSYRGYFESNSLYYEIPRTWGTGGSRKHKLNRHGTSLTSFPKAYEVLYELYNTMLIERMQSRRKTQFPTNAQMRALNDAVYYKKMMARATQLDRALVPDLVFPNASDFSSSGLTMSVSSRVMEISRMTSSQELQVEPTGESEMHPSLRYKYSKISLYEKPTKKYKTVDTNQCNARVPTGSYYPFKFQEEVLNILQGCCASECEFMALYGRTFSESSANCCSGCNRFKCEANDFAVAKLFADISTVEVARKRNIGPEQMTIFV